MAYIRNRFSCSLEINNMMMIQKASSSTTLLLDRPSHHASVMVHCSKQYLKPMAYTVVYIFCVVRNAYWDTYHSCSNISLVRLAVFTIIPYWYNLSKLFLCYRPNPTAHLYRRSNLSSSHIVWSRRP